MAEERVVVYTAQQGRDADILITHLSTVGIEADKEPGQESEQAPRWQVTVSGRDEYHAREVVGGFESVIEVAPPWPRCPRCDTQRTTKCPICPASGTDFDVVDPEFAGTLGVSGDSSDAAGGCGSSCSCGHQPQSAARQSDNTEAAEQPAPQASLPRLALMCPICDEPFVPDFPRHCEWCGHEFADGYDAQDLVEHEAIPLQAMIVILGLLALVLVTCAYFAWLV